MPFRIVKTDITKMKTDAIVNMANYKLRMTGGICQDIFLAAGAERMEAACRRIGRCGTGHAVITPGYRLPARYVIHAVGPVWHGGKREERRELEDTYNAVFRAARSRQCRSVALPLLSVGIHGYPGEEAMDVLIQCVARQLSHSPMEIWLVAEDAGQVFLNEQIKKNLDFYLEYYFEDHSPERTSRAAQPGGLDREFRELLALYRSADREQVATLREEPRLDLLGKEIDVNAFLRSGGGKSRKTEEKRPSEEAGSRKKDGSMFARQLMRHMEQKRATSGAVCAGANLRPGDIKVYYRRRPPVPDIQEVMAWAVGLGLSIDETRDLLQSAGYSFSAARRSDVILWYFLENGIYDIHQINRALFAMGQPQLGRMYGKSHYRP